MTFAAWPGNSIHVVLAINYRELKAVWEITRWSGTTVRISWRVAAGRITGAEVLVKQPMVARPGM